mgnify:CR=1 FL=1
MDRTVSLRLSKTLGYVNVVDMFSTKPVSHPNESFSHCQNKMIGRCWCRSDSGLVHIYPSALYLVRSAKLNRPPSVKSPVAVFPDPGVATPLGSVIVVWVCLYVCWCTHQHNTPAKPVLKPPTKFAYFLLFSSLLLLRWRLILSTTVLHSLTFFFYSNMLKSWPLSKKERGLITGPWAILKHNKRFTSSLYYPCNNLQEKLYCLSHSS